MSLVTTLLLNQPIKLPPGPIREHYMDGKRPSAAGRSNAGCDEKIIDALFFRPLSAADIAAECDFAMMTVKSALARLMDIGKVSSDVVGCKVLYGLTGVV